MSSAFESTEEVKDRSKWIWLGIVALFAAMLMALWLNSRPSSSISQVRAKHILIQFNMMDPADRTRAMETITELRERILAGENFGKLAKDYSDDPSSAARGGDLGYYPKGSFEENFENYVWDAPLHQLSEIIKTGHGFHLIIVEDRIWSKSDKYERDLRNKVLQKTEKDQQAE